MSTGPKRLSLPNEDNFKYETNKKNNGKYFTRKVGTGERSHGIANSCREKEKIYTANPYDFIPFPSFGFEDNDEQIFDDHGHTALKEKPQFDLDKNLFVIDETAGEDSYTKKNQKVPSSAKLSFNSEPKPTFMSILKAKAKRKNFSQKFEMNQISESNCEDKENLGGIGNNSKNLHEESFQKKRRTCNYFDN